MEDSDVKDYLVFLITLTIWVSHFLLKLRFCFFWLQKATALKKAYAEMILNTAKESAARVMVSDRKTAWFHHDLCGTKDEALRLLVRLKQMIDAKVK